MRLTGSIDWKTFFLFMHTFWFETTICHITEQARAPLATFLVFQVMRAFQQTEKGSDVVNHYSVFWISLYISSQKWSDFWGQRLQPVKMNAMSNITGLSFLGRRLIVSGDPRRLSDLFLLLLGSMAGFSQTKQPSNPLAFLNLVSQIHTNYTFPRGVKSLRWITM